MDFEKFLKKNTVFVDAFNRVVEDPLNPTYKFKAVSLESLGEWAWDNSIMIRDVLKSGFEKDKKDYDLMASKAGTLYEIAVACLGRGEVKKRLKKLEEMEK